MQKAHAQWGLPEGTASFEGGNPPPSRSQLQLSPVSPYGSLGGRNSADATPGSLTSPSASASPPRYVAVAPTFDQRGVEFYVNQYIIGHPDEPRAGRDISTKAPWVGHPALQDIIVATGLAGLANLTANKEMMTVARQRYGRALRETGQLVQSKNVNPLLIMRGVVMLALFEVGHHSLASTHP